MERSDGELKYLGFVKMIAINTMMCVLNLYECAKQKSGPLKSTLQTMENAVTAAIGPVYEKYKGVPDVAVGFLDKKVVFVNTQLFVTFSPFQFLLCWSY